MKEHRYWVEKTLVKGRPDRTDGAHALGKALWSPQRAKNAADIYRLMREAKPGDIVFHFIDNSHIDGISIVDSIADDKFVGLPGTEWEGRPCYRVALSRFSKLEPSIVRKDFLDGKQYRAELEQILTNHTNLFFNRSLNLNQGHYLTEAPLELVNLWNQIYSAKTGHTLPNINIEGNPYDKTQAEIYDAITPLIQTITNLGFVFEPWEIATYIAALRTKPFVILAGVSGTGKSKLPKLVAEATGGESLLIPVRPDWTDSSDILGYCDLQGRFRPGKLLQFIRKASENTEKHFVCIIDEMNLARVEHYFAEVLSHIEDRHLSSLGGFESKPLLNLDLKENEALWAEQKLPPNLAIVGTVNMDESAHGFSRKVLDRAFTIELSDVDLTTWESGVLADMPATSWPAMKWYPRAIQLGGLGKLTKEEREIVDQVVAMLVDINKVLIQAQLQVGYRTRDEIALFVLNAQELKSSFVTRTGKPVAPLDLALLMKILPRLAGGSNAVRRILLQLLGWSHNGKNLQDEEVANSICREWEKDGCQGDISNARFPRTAARLCLMWNRLLNEGFTSFWL